ncbi:hypothetical protein ANO11243_007080 [Dothideomycetidae sp. 11243]|nr:hypothetical protein ANO11243_007080 [fungal sp. No.11243]
MQLKDAAFSWFEPYLSNFLDGHHDDDTKKIFSNFNELSDAIKDKMILEPPDSLQELIDQSIKIDNRLYERRMEKNGGYRIMPRYNSKHVYGDPMELDAIGAGRSSRAKGRPQKGKFLSGKEREKCRQENLCFKCERPGHRARDCRTALADGLHMIIAGPVGTKADTTEEDPNTKNQRREIARYLATLG